MFEIGENATIRFGICAENLGQSNLYWDIIKSPDFLSKLTAEISKVSAFNDTQSNIQPYIRDLNVDRFTINFLTPSSAPTQSPTNNYKLGKS